MHVWWKSSRFRTHPPTHSAKCRKIWAFELYREAKAYNPASCSRRHETDRWVGVGTLVGGGYIEEGKDRRFKGVVDFDHVHGSIGLSRFSQDDEGPARKWVGCHALERGAGRCFFSRIPFKSSPFVKRGSYEQLW